MKLLLQHDADMLLRDISGLTASDLADKAGHINCTNILKEAYSECLLNFFFKIKFERIELLSPIGSFF